MTSFIPIILSIVMAILYTAISSTGIRVFNSCNEIKDELKWKNMHMLLSNTLVIGIMIPVVLLAQMLSNGNITGAIMILYGLIGLIGGSTAYGIVNENKCAEVSKESEKNFLMISIAGSFFILLGGGALLAMSRRE